MRAVWKGVFFLIKDRRAITLWCFAIALLWNSYQIIVLIHFGKNSCEISDPGWFWKSRTMKHSIMIWDCRFNVNVNNLCIFLCRTLKICILTIVYCSIVWSKLLFKHFSAMLYLSSMCCNYLWHCIPIFHLEYTCLLKTASVKNGCFSVASAQLVQLIKADCTFCSWMSIPYSSNLLLS